MPSQLTLLLPASLQEPSAADVAPVPKKSSAPVIGRKRPALVVPAARSNSPDEV